MKKSVPWGPEPSQAGRGGAGGAGSLGTAGSPQKNLPQGPGAGAVILAFPCPRAESRLQGNTYLNVP